VQQDGQISQLLLVAPIQHVDQYHRPSIMSAGRTTKRGIHQHSDIQAHKQWY